MIHGHVLQNFLHSKKKTRIRPSQKKAFKVLTMKRSPKKQHYKVAKADTATIKHSNVSYFQIAKRANTGSKTDAPKLLWKRIDQRISRPACTPRNLTTDHRTRTNALSLSLSLSLSVRFLPYTKEVCGCKSGLIKLISEILVN
jgi:hypothetical protein